MSVNESGWKDDVTPVLLSVANKVQKNPEIELEWKMFHSEIKIDENFNVDERTQASRDVFKELFGISLKAKNTHTQIVTDGTYLHDQKFTNLCAYFATLSALTHQLKKAVGVETATQDVSKMLAANILQHKLKRTQWTKKQILKKFTGLSIEDYIEKIDEYRRLFEQNLAVMISCVSPRALSVRF